MSFANINIGTTPGDHSGDQLRVAFNKINNNFQQIANGNIVANITAPVQSVAGRTGNVVLTVSDVIGSITMGQVNSAIIATLAATSVSAFDNDVNYATETFVTNAIATSSANLTSNITAVESGLTVANLVIASLVQEDIDQNLDIANLQSGIIAANLVIAQNTADIVTLFANAASQASTLSTLTSNAASQGSTLDTLTSNAASQADSLTYLIGNAASQGDTLITLTANAGAQADSLTYLIGNAASQGDTLVTLTSNAASQADTLTTLLANAASQGGAIAAINANVAAANVAISALQSNAAIQAGILDILTSNAASQSMVLDTLTSNAASQADSLTYLIGNAVSQGDTLVTLTANAAAQASDLTYLISNAASQTGEIAQNTADIVTLFANAASQSGNIATLQSQVYGNVDVANYLPTFAGNLGAGNLVVGLSTSEHSIKGHAVVGGTAGRGTSNATLLINPNAVEPIPSFATLQVVGNVAEPAQISLDAHGDATSSTVILRRARGNLTVPTAVSLGDPLGAYIAKGRGDTGFSVTSSGGLNVVAAENYTDTAQGTYVTIHTTRIGSNTITAHSRFDSNGNLVIVGGSPSTSTSTGALVVKGGVGVIGNVHVGTNMVATTVLSDNYKYANGAAFIGSYTDADVGNYIDTNNIYPVGVYTDGYFYANSAPFGYTDSHVADFLTTYTGNLSVGNISIVNQTISSTGNGGMLILDFPDTRVVNAFIGEGDIVANSATASTNHNTGALTVPYGGLGVAGNVYVAGDPGARFQVGEGGQILPNVLGQFTGNTDTYIQVNMQNLSSDAFASSDFVATADNGNDSSYFIDMGIASSTYSYPGFGAIAPNDGYLLVVGGNLLLNAGEESKTINFAVGGSDAEHVVGTWSNISLDLTTKLVMSGNIEFVGSPAASISGVSSVNTVDLTATGNIAYTMGNAAHWTSPVTSVAAALDQIAARIWAIENP